MALKNCICIKYSKNVLTSKLKTYILKVYTKKIINCIFFTHEKGKGERKWKR